ncbi:hypothetical protein WG66_002329, partial [Moniliophthora roreri]
MMALTDTVYPKKRHRALPATILLSRSSSPLPLHTELNKMPSHDHHHHRLHHHHSHHSHHLHHQHHSRYHPHQHECPHCNPHILHYSPHLYYSPECPHCNSRDQPYIGIPTMPLPVMIPHPADGNSQPHRHQSYNHSTSEGYDAETYLPYKDDASQDHAPIPSPYLSSNRRRAQQATENDRGSYAASIMHNAFYIATSNFQATSSGSTRGQVQQLATVSQLQRTTTPPSSSVSPRVSRVPRRSGLHGGSDNPYQSLPKPNVPHDDSDDDIPYIPRSVYENLVNKAKAPLPSIKPVTPHQIPRSGDTSKVAAKAGSTSGIVDTKDIKTPPATTDPATSNPEKPLQATQTGKTPHASQVSESTMPDPLPGAKPSILPKVQNTNKSAGSSTFVIDQLSSSKSGVYDAAVSTAATAPSTTLEESSSYSSESTDAITAPPPVAKPHIPHAGNSSGVIADDGESATPAAGPHPKPLLNSNVVNADHSSAGGMESDTKHSKFSKGTDNAAAALPPPLNPDILPHANVTVNASLSTHSTINATRRWPYTESDSRNAAASVAASLPQASGNTAVNLVEEHSQLSDPRSPGKLQIDGRNDGAAIKQVKIWPTYGARSSGIGTSSAIPETMKIEQ